MPDRPGDMDERDVDARFASIVARWDGPVPDADRRPPADDGCRGRRRRHAHRPARRRRGHAGHPGRQDGTAEPDAGEPAAPPVTPRSPWVNPSPLDVVVPPSAWRAAEPADPDDRRRRPTARPRTALRRTSTSSRPRSCSPRRRTCTSGVPSSGWSPARSCCSGSSSRGPSHSTRWFVVSVVVSLVGFGLLVLRQPKHRDPTSGDNGARV